MVSKALDPGQSNLNTIFVPEKATKMVHLKIKLNKESFTTTTHEKRLALGSVLFEKILTANGYVGT